MKKIIFNWKGLPNSLEDAKATLNEIKKNFPYRITDEDFKKKIKVTLLAPFPFFLDLNCLLKKSKILDLGIQDISVFTKEKFTGEISVEMAKGIGCRHVLIGHQERREYLGETDDINRMKVQEVLNQDIEASLCIGLLEQEKVKDEDELLVKKLKANLKEVGYNKFSFKKNLNIVYQKPYMETFDSNKIMMKIMILKKTLVQIYGDKVLDKVSILYNGDIDSGIIKELEKINIDGYMIEQQYLQPISFCRMCREIKI